MGKCSALIVSITDFSDSKNGGGLFTANLMETIALVPAIEFTVILAGPESINRTNEEFVRSLGLNYKFLAFRPTSRLFEDGYLGAIARVARSFLNMMAEKYYFPWERESITQSHIDAEFMRLLQDIKPDLVVINYLFSALFIPSLFSTDTPRGLISLNDEAAFHRSLKLHGGPVGTAFHKRVARLIYQNFNWIPDARVARFERRTYEACNGIVALTRNDLPKELPETIVQAVLPPIFKQAEQRWTYTASRRIFFVGNYAYYPNRLAIEWLCSELAPELLKLDNRIQLSIIGASSEQVPGDRRPANVDLMGSADRVEVIRQMTTADLFVAPILNAFGAKIKLAECVAYGMPFVATQTALSGLTFLNSVPTFAVDKPHAAAVLIAKHLDDPESLQGLSQSNSMDAQRARAAQTGEWDAFLRQCMESASKPIYRV